MTSAQGDRRDVLMNISIGPAGESSAAVRNALRAMMTEHGWTHVNLGSPIAAADVAILVVSAVECPLPDERAELRMARTANVPHLIVALTEVDKVDDPELLDLIDLEVRQSVKESGYRSDSPVVHLSTLRVVHGSRRAAADVAQLTETLEGYLGGHR